jgi:divalent metal cation (Fe/Co/Zn/Cd) transporter
MPSGKTIYRINSREEKLLQTALILAIVTIVYNVAEGVVSIFFGIADETLALLGFGVDSFVEVLSGAGILHMISRMKRAGISDVSSRDRFERRALKITGTAFYILAGGLLAGSVINIVRGTKPETTVAGIIISGLSILTMYLLMTWKYRIGRKLNSEAIIADAGCTKTCFYLSIILFASSALYELVGIGWVDIAGSLGIAWFAYTEGKEAFEKSNQTQLSCSDCP